jgi:hypothetical protein
MTPPRRDGVPLARRALAEFLGSAFLAATVIGSGIAAARVSPGDTGLQLIEHGAILRIDRCLFNRYM